MWNSLVRLLSGAVFGLWRRWAGFSLMQGPGHLPIVRRAENAETAAHLVDHVLPAAPVRQWVLTPPYRLRFLVAFDRRLCCEVRGLFTRSVLAWLRRRAVLEGIDGGRGGAVVFVQRFGSALNLNPHLHAIVLDGVFYRRRDGELGFWRVRRPDQQDLEELVVTVHVRVRRLLQRRGLLEEDAVLEEGELVGAEPLLAACQAASVSGSCGVRSAAGGGSHSAGSGARDGGPYRPPGRDRAEVRGRSVPRAGGWGGGTRGRI